jgi:hypothetical protein
MMGYSFVDNNLLIMGYLLILSYPFCDVDYSFVDDNFPEKTSVFPAKKLGQFSAQRAPLGLVII